MMKWYSVHEDAYCMEEINKYLYCLFSFPLLKEDGNMIRNAEDMEQGRLERLILFVYDKDTIIADCSAIHAAMQDVVFFEPAVELICTESDWMYLEHYTLCTSAFPEIPYPAPFDEEQETQKGEALIYSNAYVTTSYRRNGIFANMLQIVRDHALRYSEKHVELYSVIALDPDVACYGPDAVEEPYIYSYEKDEPLRQRNCTIMRHVGFVPVKLEELEPKERGDGAKLWFALRHEKDLIVETAEKFS